MLGDVHVTIYQLVKPTKDIVEYDVVLIALSETHCLTSFTNGIPLFIRFLKVVTDQEDREDDFIAFFERMQNNLTMESEVFVSTEELLTLIWNNYRSE